MRFVFSEESEVEYPIQHAPFHCEKYLAPLTVGVGNTDVTLPTPHPGPYVLCARHIYQTNHL